MQGRHSPEAKDADNGSRRHGEGRDGVGGTVRTTSRLRGEQMSGYDRSSWKVLDGRI